MVWPKKIKQQIITDEPFVTSDYFPTILDILDIDLPNDRSYDGESFLPLINDSSFKRSNAIGFAFQHTVQQKVRNQLSYQLADYKLYAKDEVFELYNIKKDPYETNDLAGKSRYSDRLNDMIEAYKVWLQSVKDSFDGLEYGTTSYDRMEQVFVSPLNITLSRNDFSDAFSDVAVYPNPTEDKLRIGNYKEKGVSAIIINLDGKRVYKSSEVEEFIDISSLPSGVYILQLKNKNGSEKKFKVVKK
jgi:hypothetical protein